MAYSERPAYAPVVNPRAVAAWEDPALTQLARSYAVQGKSRAAGAMGLGGLGAVAETVHKSALTASVAGLEAIDPAPMLSQVEDVEASLRSVDPWDDSSWWNGYDSAQGLWGRLGVLRAKALANMMLGVAASSDSAENRRAAAAGREVLGGDGLFERGFLALKNDPPKVPPLPKFEIPWGLVGATLALVVLGPPAVTAVLGGGRR